MQIRISDIQNVRLSWILRNKLQTALSTYVRKKFNDDENNSLITRLKNQILEELIEKYPFDKMNDIQQFLLVQHDCKKRIYLYPSLLDIFCDTRDNPKRIIDFYDILRTSTSVDFGSILIQDQSYYKSDLIIGEIDLPYPMYGVLQDSVLIWKDYIILAANGTLWSEKTSQLLNFLLDTIKTRLQKNYRIIEDYNILIRRAKNLREILSLLPESIIQYLIDSQVLKLKGHKLGNENCCDNNSRNAIPKDVLNRLRTYC